MLGRPFHIRGDGPALGCCCKNILSLLENTILPQTVEEKKKSSAIRNTLLQFGFLKNIFSSMFIVLFKNISGLYEEINKMVYTRDQT